MCFVLERVLTHDEVSFVRTKLAGQIFLDGRSTSDVPDKHNLQLPLDNPIARSVGEFISQRLAEHECFQQKVYPAAIIPPIFSRYEPGMLYPKHIDSALMRQGRADVSVTLFLSDLNEYEGGELEIETESGEQCYRLPAGDALVYPSTTLHRVAPVIRGVRDAAVTWVQSMVRDAAQREILAELGHVARELPDGPYADRVRRSHANLERMWLEP